MPHPVQPELIERDTFLATLEAKLASVAQGCGHVVLVAGEAGVGKSSLVKALAGRRGQARLWLGACDALQTPHPLAPLHDIVRSCDVGFRSLLEVVPLDASLVRGSHGRAPSSVGHSPLFITQRPDLLEGSTISPTDVCGLLLRHLSPLPAQPAPAAVIRL